MIKSFRYALLGAACTALIGTARAFGPFDYTNPEHRKKHLSVVEQYHFRKEEMVLQKDDETIWKDLAYTLRSFPNHHGALEAMGRLLRMEDPGIRIYGKPTDHTADYYFNRAASFAPNDGNVHLLYGIHLHLSDQLDAALKEYKAAEKLLKNSASLHYNMGLLYFERGQNKEALEQAKRAYALGHPLPGLHNKLKQAGILK